MNLMTILDSGLLFGPPYMCSHLTCRWRRRGAAFWDDKSTGPNSV